MSSPTTIEWSTVGNATTHAALVGRSPHGGTTAKRCVQDIIAAPACWVQQQVSSHGTTTPSRPMPPMTVTSSSSMSNVSMGSASGLAQRSSGTRGRQQLAPRHLDYDPSRDANAEKQPAACAPTPTRVLSTPVVVPVPPTHPTPYYAVARGRRVGVYTSITEVHEEIQGYDYHVYRLCATRQEGDRFIDKYFDVTHGRRSDPDPRHRSTLVAFCDGATQGNRNWSHQTGVACVFPHNPAWDIVYTCLDAYCTAYRATAKAALAAINRANKENPTRDQVLYIYTRNQLLVRAMTEWMEKWLQNDWRKGDGYPVKNRDVLQSIVEAQGSRRILWRLSDDWAPEWTASVVSAAQDAAVDVGELIDAHCT